MSLDPLSHLVSLEGVPSAYAAVRDGIDVMLRDRGLRRTSPEMTAESLRGVGQLLTAPTDAPALLVAALVHATLATTAPFASHNGLVARAAERLVLVARGVDEKSLVVPEAGHLALRAAYESNLRGYRDGGGAGVHAWLLYAAEAYAAGAEASPLRRGAD